MGTGLTALGHLVGRSCHHAKALVREKHLERLTRRLS